MAVGDQLSGWYTASTVSVMKIHWNLIYDMAVVQFEAHARDDNDEHLEFLCLQNEQQVQQLARGEHQAQLF